MNAMDEESHGRGSPAVEDPPEERSALLGGGGEVKENKGLTRFSGVLSLTIGLLLLAGSLAYLSIGRTAEYTTFYSSKPVREIMLFGDSLVGVPEVKYDISDHLEKGIEKKEKNFDVTVSTSGENGNTVSDLLKRVDSDVLSRKSYGGDSLPVPDAVIVLFDSDAADVDEGSKPAKIREAYKEKLITLLDKLTAKIDYVALSGPILMGELPEGENPRDEQMDAYETINKEVASKYHIDYIPLREEFEAAEPNKSKYEAMKKGKLTMDGEHPLHQGEAIIESSFLKQILSWGGLWKASSKSKNLTRREQLDATSTTPVVVAPKKDSTGAITVVKTKQFQGR